MRPDFSLIWGADNAPFTAIEASDYTAGWVFRTGAPPRRVNFDYFQNLSDQRTAWLGEQMLLAVGHEWQDDVTYDAYAITRSPADGQLYRSLVGGNLGNEPSVSGAEWAIGIVQQATGLPLGYFSGFNLANDVGAPNTTISVAAGAARDSANTVNIELSSSMRGILQSSGAWAAGDNQNKLDAGARAANTWYHAHGIRKISDGSADILFSLSATAPTMPVGYSGFRRISSIRTNGSGNIIGFLNAGDLFLWKAPPLDVNVGMIVNAAYAISVPTGVRVMARFAGALAANEGFWSYRATDTDAIVPSYQNYVGGAGVSTTSVDNSAMECEVLTNTSAQAHYQTEFSAGPFKVVTYGWRELRV